jgi:hypothetical protein
MKHLSEFIHLFDFLRARPLTGWITDKPAPLVEATLAVEGKDYAVYLADSREVTDPNAGRPIEGRVSFRLPGGSFRVGFYSPTTGASSLSLRLDGPKVVTVDLPAFRHDVVLRATRGQ